MPATAIEALLREMIRRWNTHEPETFVAVFTEDADFTDVIGQTAAGKAQIAKQHEFPFTRTMRDAVLTADRIDIRLLSDSVATALVRWTATGNLSPDGAALPPRQGILHLVCVSAEHAGWQVASALNTDLSGVYSQHFKPGSTFSPP